MAKNFVQEGDDVLVTIAAAAGVKSGGGVLVGSLFGIAAKDAKQTETVIISTEGVFDMPKVSAEAWAVGDPIYWVAASSLVTNVAGVNQLIGVALEVEPNPSSSGRVRLNGPPGIVPDITQGAALADLSGSLTGTVNGSVADVAHIAIATATNNTYSDAAVNTAVNAMVDDVNTQLKELQAKLNAALARLRTAGVIGE